MKETLYYIYDWSLPYICYLCQRNVLTDSGLCGACWQELNIITTPLCDRCGIPFEIEYAVDKPVLCLACVNEPQPRPLTMRSLWEYNYAAKKLIYLFKACNKQNMALFFARVMVLQLEDKLPREFILAPTPMHPYRLFWRGFNQALLITKALNQEYLKRGKTPLMQPYLLKRTRYTKAQKFQDRKTRTRNVKNAFAINPKYAALIKNKPVLLIDDVLTTGATLEACSQVLLKAGATHIYWLTLARVFGPLHFQRKPHS